MPTHPAFEQLVALFDEYRAHYGRTPSPRETRDWLGYHLAACHITIAAAIQAGTACGFITVAATPASLTLGTAWSIRDLYVAPPHRRTGIARTLLRQVID